MAQQKPYINKNSIWILCFLLAVVAIFEFIPAIKHGRYAVPENIYAGKICDCDCIRALRPWYSQFNYWFWLWVIVVPVVMFALAPNAPRWQEGLKILTAIILCYFAMCFALHLSYDIKYGLFVVRENYEWQKTWDINECIPRDSDFSKVFIFIIGWFYATVYTGFWEILWQRFHKSISKKINADYKPSIEKKILIWMSFYFPLAIGFIVSIAAVFMAIKHYL